MSISKKIGISIITILIIGVVVFFSTKKEQTFKVVNIPFNNVLIHNETNKPYIDTIVQLGLRKLEIDSCLIVVKNLQSQSSSDDRDVYGKLIEHEGTYVLYLKDLNRIQSIEVISHELIHLKQYHEKRLIVKNDSIQWDSFKNSTSTWMMINYNNRPWEIESFQKQDSLINYLTNILY